LRYTVSVKVHDSELELRHVIALIDSKLEKHCSPLVILSHTASVKVQNSKLVLRRSETLVGS